MTLQAKRLRWVRENLRRPDGRPVDKHALSRALGWPEHRWKNLEGAAPWGEDSQAWVREGLPALLARTTLPEEAGQRAVRFVLGETKTPPWSSPPSWREGQCPEGKRVGRPPRALSSSSARRDDLGVAYARPILPETVRLSQVDAILVALAAGEVDRGTALEAIADLYEPLRSYYNKHEKVERS